MNPIERYIRGSLHELRQVRWPTRNQAIRLSVITIIFTISVAIAYGAVDFILGQGMSLLLRFA